MFNKKEIEALKEKINTLEKEKECLFNYNSSLNSRLDKIEVEIEKKLIEFHREITKQYFDSLENIFRTNREISLLNNLALQLKDKDFENLKASLMQPFLEAKWKKQSDEKGEKIISKGVKVIEKRNELHKEMLDMEKKGLPTDKIKEQIKGFDWIIKEVSNDKG